MKKIAFIAFMAFVFWKLLFDQQQVVVLEAGIKADSAPVQVNIEHKDYFQFEGFQISPLAEFKIKAKVLAREDYLLGKESQLSPTDLVLGWGDMSDETVLKDIEISQSGRWYHWNVERFPIPRRKIETQSANMHMIPANDHIEKMIEAVKQGQIIELEGYLVRVDDVDAGWHWQSSLSRDDTGNGACEIVFVTDFAISAEHLLNN